MRKRGGRTPRFQRIDDPYEEPLKPEITLETISRTAEDNAQVVLNHLAFAGFVRGDTTVHQTDRPIDADTAGKGTERRQVATGQSEPGAR
jgi:hypothetical protein